MGTVLAVCVPFLDVVIAEEGLVAALGVAKDEMTLYQCLSLPAQGLIQARLADHSKYTVSYGGTVYNTCVEIAEHHPGAESVFIGPFSTSALSRRVFDPATAGKVPGLSIRPFYLDTYPGACYIIPNQQNRCMITQVNPKMEVTREMVELLFQEIDTRRSENFPGMLVYAAGYTIESSPAMQAIAQRHERGQLRGMLCLNLSDPGVLKRSFAQLLPFLRCSEWVIGNRAEFNELAKCYLNEYPASEEALYRCLKQHLKNAVITAGPHSVVVLRQAGAAHELSVFHPPKIAVSNTSGAGDVFAAGFLSGLVLNRQLAATVDAAMTRTAAYLQEIR